MITEIDIEEYAKNNQQVPKGRRYKIRVDREKFITDQECMSGKEILILAGKTPYSRYQLNQRIHGTVKKVEYDEKVDFTTPGVERFYDIAIRSN